MKRKKILAGILACAIALPPFASSFADFVNLRQVEAAEEQSSDFVINDGVLTSYKGTESNVTIPEGVTQISSQAFYKNNALESVKLPSGLKTIGRGAFYGCTKLKDIEIPDSVSSISEYAFAYCYQLEEVSLPSQLAEISSNLFLNCNQLKTIKMPNQPEYVSVTAFSGTKWLENEQKEKEFVIINDFLYCAGTCSGDITIPNTVHTILSGAFTNNQGITSVTMPASVQGIGSDAFSNCANLKKVTVSSNISSFRCFSGCTALEQAVFTEGVTVISNLFNGCTALKRVSFPQTLVSVEANAFSGCAGLDLNAAGLEKCKDLEELDLSGAGIEDISVLENCSSLEILRLQSNAIKDISALNKCSALKSLDLRNNQISDWSQIENLTLAEDADLYIAGNPCSDAQVAVWLENIGTVEVVVGLTTEIKGNDNIKFADGLSDLLADKNELTVTSQDEAIVKADGLSLKGIKAGQTTVMVKAGSVTQEIPVTVIEEIKAVDAGQIREELPTLESGYDDTVVLNWNHRIWYANTKGIGKVADISEKDKKYVARVVYNDKIAKISKIDCYVLDEEKQLWNWTDDTKERVDVDVEQIDAKKLVLKGGQDQGCAELKTNGDVLKDGVLCLSGAAIGAVTEFSYDYALTADHILYVDLSPLKAVENVKSVNKGRETSYYLLDNEDCYSFYNQKQPEALLDRDGQYIKTEQGWFSYNEETKEKTATEFAEIERPYFLTKDGTLYYQSSIYNSDTMKMEDVKLMLLSGVDSFICPRGWGDVYALRKDGTVWKCSDDNKPELINDMSEVYNYAEEPGIVTSPSVVIPGDIDGDKDVTLADANLALTAALGIVDLEELQMKAADVNGDGQVTLEDANMILRAALGITSLEQEKLSIKAKAARQQEAIEESALEQKGVRVMQEDANLQVPEIPPRKGTSPKTADENRMSLYLLLLGLAAITAGCGALSLKGQKKGNTGKA